MLSNAYFLAKFRFDTAENEPVKNLQNFCKFCKILQNLPILLTRRTPPRSSTSSRRSAARSCSSSRTASTPSSRRSSSAAPHGSRRSPWRATGARQLAKFRQIVARFRLYRLRFLQENMRFSAFFKIYTFL